MDINDTPLDINNEDSTLLCKLTTENKLYEAYMPFIKDGGIFIKTKNTTYKMGDRVNLKLFLLADTIPTLVSGKVAWISPEHAHGGFSTGIGIQLEGNEGKELRKRIEALISGKLSINGKTDTL